MSPIRRELQRELRVAFSPRAQPVWFRIVKWTALIVLALLFWRRPAFWWAVGCIAIAAVPVHLFYRWKTARWTRPWGGWNDLDAGR